MNWGLKIVFGLGAFMLFIVGAGVYMVSKDTDTLVAEDYYEKSITYNEVYRQKQNVLDHQVRPAVLVRNDTLYITFVKPENRGNLIFNRPSDNKLDLSLPFLTNSRYYQLPIGSFVKGSWRLEISWQQNGTQYSFDHNLYL